MLLSLIKKDFLIIKKYLALMFIIAVVLPPFLILNMPEYAAPIGHVFVTIFVIYMLLQYVFLKEYQYPKATALLCSAPYPRSLMVLSKYCFLLVAFFCCNLIFFAETLIIPQLGSFSAEAGAAALLIVSIVAGVYFPLQYKFGYEKCKFIPFILIIITPMLFSNLPEQIIRFEPGTVMTMPPAALAGVLAAAALTLLAASFLVSSRIYKKKDLL